jgi:hypothetical protein
LLSAALDTVQLEGDTILDLFKWVARTIRYEELPHSPGYPRTSNVLINEALVNGYGVCEHFAELFAAAVMASGYRAHVVHGFTEQSDSEGHAWVTIRTKNGWREYDPTWGAGYMIDSVYHPQLDLKWFDVSSDSMRKSHTPLQPVWSMTYLSIAQQDSVVETYFGMDTLHRSLANITYLEQLVPNPKIKDYLEYNRALVALFSWKNGIDQLNEAVIALNDFIDCRSHYFRKPRWDDDTIERKSSDLVRLTSIAQTTLTGVDSTRIQDQELYLDSLDHAEKVDQMAQMERAIAVKYLNTWKPIRASVLW